MFVLMASVILGWNPDRQSAAYLESGLANTPWAKYTGSVPSEVLNCTGSTTTGYGIAFSVDDATLLWRSLYVPIQNNMDGTMYVVYSASGKRAYVCSSDPTSASSGVEIAFEGAVLYTRCPAGGSRAPTTSAPTPPPSAGPTKAPTTQEEYEQTYGPSTEEECIASGGYDWDTLLYDNSSVPAVRYCCGVPQCKDIYRDEQFGLEGCACKPKPGEVQVRNNGGTCYFCPDEPYPAMVYCDDTAGCNGTVDGENWNCSGLLENACIENGANEPHGAYTASPTPAPTPRIRIDVCWTYDDNGCYSDDSETWCNEADFKTYGNYTIQNRSGFLGQWGIRIEDYYELNALARSTVQDIVVGAVEDVLGTGTCWCTARNLNWMPYGPIVFINVTTDQTSLSYTNSYYPFPRLFLTGSLGTGNDLYLHSLRYPIAAFTYVQLLDGAYSLKTPSDAPDDDIFAPTEVDCGQAGCTWIEPYENILVPDLETCRFVCINTFYVQDEDGVRNAPLSVSIQNGVKTESECGGATWVNARALSPMLLQDQWQRYANNVGYRGTFQSVPWQNFTQMTVDPSTNCKLTANKFCMPASTGYDSYVAWYCNGMNQDTGVYTLYNSINYSGIKGLNVPSVECGGSIPTSMETLKVIPDIGFEETPIVSEQHYTSVRTQLNEIFWRIFLEYPNEDECNGTYTQDIVYDDDGNVFSVNVSMVWIDLTNAKGCIGLDGCSAFSDFCLYEDVPGCIWVPESTSTTTTASQTVGTFGTFPPVATTANPLGGGSFTVDSSNKTATYITAGVATVFVFIAAIVYIVMYSAREHGDEEEGEQLMPMIMG